MGPTSKGIRRKWIEKKCRRAEQGARKRKKEMGEMRKPLPFTVQLYPALAYVKLCLRRSCLAWPLLSALVISRIREITTWQTSSSGMSSPAGKR